VPPDPVPPDPVPPDPVPPDPVQPPLSIVLASSVTAPLRASNRPWNVAPVRALIEVSASTSPTNRVLVAKVAELPTCHTTLHAEAPLTSRTRLSDAVIKVDAA
jgi:hypothetical protein